MLAKLKIALTEAPLPGSEAQFSMSPADNRGYTAAPNPDYRKAAVLLLLYPKDKVWHLVYIKRTSTNTRDKHRGQISFPGGKVELSDKDLAHTALREAQEEIGINPQDVELLGPLTPLHVYVSNFMVYPYMGITEITPTFIKQESEVSDIIEVPLNYIIDHSIKERRDISVREVVLKQVPYYNLYGEKLWGASAMITAEFLTLLESSDGMKILSEF